MTPETLIHPGPAPTERIVSVRTRSRVVRGVLAAGELVTEGLWRLLEQAGGRAASAELNGGELAVLPYVYPAVTDRADRAVSFCTPTAARNVAVVQHGSVTIGHRFGERYSHVHACWLDGGVPRGGHLLEGATVGAIPVNVVMHVYDDLDLVSTDDPETGMPTFCPHPAVGGVPGVRPANVVVSRVRPGVDLVDAVRRVCLEAGWNDAIVHSTLGSTVGARLVQDDRPVHVPGPAVEYIQLTGVVSGARSAMPDIRMTGTCVDIDGRLHTGTIIPGQNPIAVTLELVVEGRDLA